MSVTGGACSEGIALHRAFAVRIQCAYSVGCSVGYIVWVLDSAHTVRIQCRLQCRLNYVGFAQCRLNLKFKKLQQTLAL